MENNLLVSDDESIPDKSENCPTQRALAQGKIVEENKYDIIDQMCSFKKSQNNEKMRQTNMKTSDLSNFSSQNLSQASEEIKIPINHYSPLRPKEKRSPNFSSLS